MLYRSGPGIAKMEWTKSTTYLIPSCIIWDIGNLLLLLDSDYQQSSSASTRITWSSSNNWQHSQGSEQRPCDAHVNCLRSTWKCDKEMKWRFCWTRKGCYQSLSYSIKESSDGVSLRRNKTKILPLSRIMSHHEKPRLKRCMTISEASN